MTKRPKLSREDEEMLSQEDQEALEQMKAEVERAPKAPPGTVSDRWREKTKHPIGMDDEGNLFPDEG